MKPTRVSKAFLVLSLLAVFSMLVSCAPAPTPVPTKAPAAAPTSPPAAAPTKAPAAPTTAPAAAGPQKGGTLNLGFEGTYEHDLWPWLAETWHADDMSHNTLVRVKNDLTELLPELATKWDTSADNKTFTFYLRKDVKWHDGKPFTADDVVFTYNALCHIKTGTQYCAQFFGNIDGLKDYREGKTTAIAGVKKIDDYTVSLTFTGPHPINLWWVGYLYIWPKHLLGDTAPENLRANDYWRKSRVGTGPFKFESYTPKQSIVYVRNDDFWGQKPYIDKAIWRIYDKTETALLALEKGEIDTWAGYAAIPITEIPRFQAMPNVTVMPGPSGVTNYIMVNQANPKFPWGAKKEWRQAMMYCIDKKTLIDTMWSKTYAENLDVSVLQKRYLKPDIKKYTYDPVAAKKLLDSISYDYNFEVELVWYYSGKFWEDMGAAMQAQAAKCGIKLKPKFVDSPT